MKTQAPHPSTAEEYIKVHDKILVLRSRERTVELLLEIVNRADKGDIVFGHPVTTKYIESI